MEVLLLLWSLSLPLTTATDADQRCGDAPNVEEGHTAYRVRSNTPRIAAVIANAMAHSETLRRLITAIDATDGLVYVDEGTCRHGVRACLPLSVKVAGPNRLLRVVVDTHKAGAELVASIGHELQHALEVLSDPRVRSNSDMYYFFGRLAPTGVERFETVAALRAGLDIRDELDAAPCPR